MPSVPMYNRPTVTPTPRRAITVPAAAEGATLAASALGTAAEAFQKERERAGRIRADAAEAKIRGIGARLGDEVSRMQREQAFGAETMVGERWDVETSKVLSEIADPEVRSAVQRRSDILRGEIVEQARRHGLNQQEVVRKESFLTNMQSNIATLASTPLAQAESILVRMDEAARANARAEGRDEAGIEREAQRIRATGRYAQITALVSNDAPDEALAYLERDDVKKEMQSVIESDGRTLYDKARKLVESESMDIRAQEARDSILQRFTNVDDALDAVKNEQKGAMEVRVRQYVEQAFADKENRIKRDVAENRNLAIQAINAGRPIPAEQRRFFESTPEGAEAFKQLLEFQTTKAKGEEPNTDWALYTDLINEYTDSPTKFASKDLSAYINRLSPRHYEEMIKLSAGLRGGRPPSLSVYAANQFVWEQARKTGIIPQDVLAGPDLKKKNAETQARFAQFETALRTALETALTANPRLTAEEQLAVMQGVVDTQVILRQTSFGIDMGRRDTIPAAAVRPGDRVVGTFTQQRVHPIDKSVPLSPAALTRARALQAEGKTADEVALTLRQEGLLSPTP